MGEREGAQIFCRLLKSVLVWVLFYLFPPMLMGQGAGKEADSNTLRSFGISASYTYALAHTPEIDEVKGSRPIGLSFSYQKQYLDSLTWEHCGCFPRAGILGGWFHLDDPGTLGNSYFLSGFAEPFVWTGRKVDLSLRGVFGGAYQDTPYHPDKNPKNQAYSTHASFFLQVGLHSHIRISPNSTIKVSAVYDHSSNGGVAKPNKGLNHPGFSVGYEYALSSIGFPDHPAPSKGVQRERPRIDLAFLGGGKSVGTDHSTFYPFGGHAIKYAYPLSSLHTITLGGEWLVDGALKERMRTKGISADHQRGSIAIGHEFLMGRFIFSQQVGAYLYDPSGLDDRIYHRWGLTYHLTERYFMGIGLKAHRHIADFIDIRLGISIGKEKNATNKAG